MTPEEELAAALAAPSLEVWLDARCGLSERAYLDWARAAIAAAAEAHEGRYGGTITRIHESASAWAREPTEARAEETTRLAFDEPERSRLDTPTLPTEAHAQRAVLLAAASIESVGALWRENAELAIGEARRSLAARSTADTEVQKRLAQALVQALRSPLPSVLPQPRSGIRPGSLSGVLPPLPAGWRWHADWDPSLARHTRAAARDRSWPSDADALDRLLARVADATRATTGNWTLERRATGELEAHTMIEVLDAPDRAHVRITLLRDRRGHELITLASIGAETTGSIETQVAKAIDLALAPGASVPPPPARTRRRRTSATDLGRRVVESIVATAEGRPALPLGWRWTSSGAARTERAWPRRTDAFEAVLEAAAAQIPSGPARWTRTWRAGGPALLRASLDAAAIDVRFKDSRAAARPAEVADIEVRAPSAASIATVAHALDQAFVEP